MKSINPKILVLTETMQVRIPKPYPEEASVSLRGIGLLAFPVLHIEYIGNVPASGLLVSSPASGLLVSSRRRVVLLLRTLKNLFES